MVPGMSNRQRSPTKPRATVRNLPTFKIRSIDAEEAARTISGLPPRCRQPIIIRSAQRP
jgi:hypothetical protein